MKSVKWESVEASSDGDYPKVEPGAYVGVITGMEDNEAREYVTCLFDIAEGPLKGHFSDRFFSDKPWAHSMTLSYKDSVLGMLKQRLETIQACNPGFDPFAAWDAGRLDMFNGRKVGLVMREEEYFDKRTETFKMGSPRCFRFCRLDQLEDERNANPKPKELDDDQKVAALVRTGYGTMEAKDMVAAMAKGEDFSDVPFMPSDGGSVFSAK